MSFINADEITKEKNSLKDYLLSRDLTVGETELLLREMLQMVEGRKI